MTTPNIPASRTNVIDPKTGVVSREWYLFFLNLAQQLGVPMDYYLEVKKGNVPGSRIVHKFGAADLTTTIGPICRSGAYQTPIANTALEFVSSSANDTAAGTGAQEVQITGLQNVGGVWSEVIQTVATNGLTAVPIPIDLIRVYTWKVTKSGTYATALAGSHAGTLTLRTAGGGATWDTIIPTPFPIGRSQIGVYTVPSGETAYLLTKQIFIDTTKTADIYFFERPLANDVTTPFSAMTLIQREVGVSGGITMKTSAPKGPFVGPCDIGFMGVVSIGTSECAAEFELLLVKD